MKMVVKASHRKPFLLCFVYRPPQSLIQWIDYFENELSTPTKPNSDIISAGDFNMEFLLPDKLPTKWLIVGV